MQRIRKELFPDIQYENETICTSGEDSPLVRVLEQEKYKGKIVVSGEGSIGKSTMLTDLRIRLLAKERAYVYFNLRDLNVRIGDTDTSVKKLVNDYEGNDLIVILDSYDETSISLDSYGNSPRKTAEDLIEYCAGKPEVALLIVGARQGCRRTQERSAGGYGDYSEFDKWAQGKGFGIAVLQRFSDERIDKILSDLSERKAVSRELRELLRNTMFLSMYLEDPEADWASATNEAKFIDKYFEEVFCNKLEYQPLENRNPVKERLFSIICDIGENVFNGFCDKERNKVDFDDRTELNTIFKQEQRGTEWITTATQEKYLSYCVAKYLSGRMKEETLKENKGIIQAVSELRGKKSVLEESLYFTGQLLNKNQIRNVNEVLHKTKNECLFHSLSLILLGYNKGKIVYEKTAVERFSKLLFAQIGYLKTLVLPENIVAIYGDGFCIGCYALKHIDISKSNEKYKSIDGNLYSKDGKVLIRYAPGKREESFELPPCVERLDKLAFEGCKSLKSIIIPGPVKVIDRAAFFNCKSLEEVIIAEGVETIREDAFRDCESLRQIDVDINNGKYKSIDGNLYSKDGKVLIRYAPGKREESFKILPCVETLGSDAFYDCKSLKRVPIPGSVKRIEYRAFYDCKSLKRITIPGSVKRIEFSAFWGCKSLEEVNICEGVETIEWAAFKYCESLKRITIPGSVKAVDITAFDCCDSLRQIDVDINNGEYKSIDGNLYSKDGKVLIRYAPGRREESFKILPCVETIERDAFRHCKLLEEVIIPEGVETIDKDAFSDCESLRQIDVDINNGEYKSIDGNLYSKDGKVLIRYAPGKREESFKILPCVETIGRDAFYKCKSLEEVIISEGVETIGECAFCCCESLKRVPIPGSVKRIKSYAFRYCESLKSIIIPGPVKVIDRAAFFNCKSLEEVIIAEGVETIGEEAFKDCESLKRITIPGSVKAVDITAFDCCDSLRQIDVDINNGKYKSIDGNLYSKDGKVLIRYAPGKREESFKIPSHVETIAAFAFSGHYLSFQGVLLSVVKSQSIDDAIYGSFNIYDRVSPLKLRKLIMPSSVRKIKKDAFYDCKLLKIVYYGGTYKEWMENKFNEHVELANAKKYFYSETLPEESGNYWHFGEDGEPMIWE